MHPSTVGVFSAGSRCFSFFIPFEGLNRIRIGYKYFRQIFCLFPMLRIPILLSITTERLKKRGQLLRFLVLKEREKIFLLNWVLGPNKHIIQLFAFYSWLRGAFQFYCIWRIWSIIPHDERFSFKYIWTSFYCWVSLCFC